MLDVRGGGGDGFGEPIEVVEVRRRNDQGLNERTCALGSGNIDRSPRDRRGGFLQLVDAAPHRLRQQQRVERGPAQ